MSVMLLANGMVIMAYLSAVALVSVVACEYIGRKRGKTTRGEENEGTEQREGKQAGAI